MSEEFWKGQVHRSRYTVEDLHSGESNFQVERRLRIEAEGRVAELEGALRTISLLDPEMDAEEMQRVADAVLEGGGE